MFYSETLLSKTGPLARVWLAANIERKLTKTNILQSNIESSVSAIVDQGQAPMALRLSGQLLLGVVRIYSRKARYLLDDCNEALMKIKTAFRPGMVDLPPGQIQAVDPAALVLPDVLTELDLLAPMPDPSLLLLEPPEISRADPTLLDWGTSQILAESVEQPEPLPLEEYDLILDVEPIPEDISIEIARRAPPAPPLAEEIEEEVPKTIEEVPMEIEEEYPPVPAPEEEMEITMGPIEDEEPRAAEVERLEREVISPLSPTPSELAEIFRREEEEAVQAQRAKRRKILPADVDTEIHSSQIRAQQADRSKILKPATFLPRDPMLLALMNMQRTGGFVSSILGDGRSQGWAPELRGVLSVEVVRRSGELKRKREAGVPEEEAPLPQIEFPEVTEYFPPPEPGVEPTIPPEEIEEIPGVVRPPSPVEIPEVPPPPPLISLATVHAVHLLRDRFGPAAAESEEERHRTSVVFQEMLPEARTSRADATKMFFEVLVLATKDAVKVEQPTDVLGAPIRIRGKSGLWGARAEEQAGGEIAEQEGAGQEAVGAVPVAVGA